MTLKDLIRKNTWLSIEIKLLDLYPDEKDRISAYEDVFSQLQIMPETESDLFIVLDKENDRTALHGYNVSVYGRKKDNALEENEITSSYAIEFRPWDEWLSMEIELFAMIDFTEPEILAHCLYEMTFIGFEEAKIKASLNQLTKTAEAVENMSEEEQKKLVTIDKLISAINNRNFVIRRAQEGDEISLTELSLASENHRDYPSDDFAVWKSERTITKKYLSMNDVFVCEKDKEIIAFCSIVNLHESFRIGEIEIEKGYWLEHMFVKPENIGEGIGERLLLHLIDFCDRNSMNEIKILAAADSKKFLQKMGFDDIKEYFSKTRNETTHLMIYRL